MHLRTISVRNGDLYQQYNFYSCDNCSREIEEAWPHIHENGVHFCWECCFITNRIGEEDYIRWIGLGGMPKLRAAVKNNEIVLWTTKKPPWETSDKEIRKTSVYRNWRRNVLDRDNHECKKCGSKDKLQAHHIKPFSKYKKLRYTLSNGLTLCESCHRLEHSKKKKACG